MLGEHSFKISATDGQQTATATLSFSAQVVDGTLTKCADPPPPAACSSSVRSLHTASVGEPYGDTLCFELGSGSGRISWMLATGNLPPGLCPCRRGCRS